MNLLITASVGIFNSNDRFYLQIISANREKYYYCEISKNAARLFSNTESAKIEVVDELPDGIILAASISPS
ncbi:hypothetical protein SAMN04488055_5497 [Chitinophaga niabensis]|uniref:Uncharacterized protein n=1 Tax=Chitinophaga niabensis TaxID=536979 RepID=A0A1N6KBA2_9BACT|nr:hypothetical protein SAMN04488055_5497 [Chitinophaga niabensis]